MTDFKKMAEELRGMVQEIANSTNLLSWKNASSAFLDCATALEEAAELQDKFNRCPTYCQLPEGAEEGVPCPFGCTEICRAFSTKSENMGLKGERKQLAKERDDALERVKVLEGENGRLHCAVTVAATAEIIYHGGIPDAEAILAIQETAREVLANSSPPISQSKAAQAVVSERRRQVLEEGWSDSHDDAYYLGELVQAACVYALNAGVSEKPQPMHQLDDQVIVPAEWPWDKKWYKPKTRRYDLIRAGALIIAEIDRLERQALQEREQ